MSTTSVEVMNEMQRDHRGGDLEGEDQKDTRSFHETSAPTSEIVSEEEIDEEEVDVQGDQDEKRDETEARNPTDSVFERISEEKTSTSVDTSVRKSLSIGEGKEIAADKSISSDPEGLLSGEDKSSTLSTSSKKKKPGGTLDLNLPSADTKDDQKRSPKKVGKSPDRGPLQRMRNVPDTLTAAYGLTKDEAAKPEPSLFVDVTEQTRVQEGIQSVFEIIFR